MMFSNYGIILPIITIAALASAKTGKLTTDAAITGWIIALVIFIGTGFAGLAMLAAFFLMGTSATSWGMTVKQKAGLAEKNKGKRTRGQVMANAGVAALLGVLATIDRSKVSLCLLMTAASFASAAADTLSSELGNLYGKNYYNIVTLKPDKKGLNGVISLQGTLIGVAGSAVIAIVYGLYFGFSSNFSLIVIAGTLGNFSDSLIGATLERKGYLDNNAVNFLNTAAAALFIFLTKMH